MANTCKQGLRVTNTLLTLCKPNNDVSQSSNNSFYKDGVPCMYSYEIAQLFCQFIPIVRCPCFLCVHFRDSVTCCFTSATVLALT